MCSRSDEAYNYIAREYPKLAQGEYKRRHDCIRRCIHWEIFGVNGTHVKSKWYEHQPEVVIGNDSCKILWDFTVQTEYFITARRPDMIFIDKEHHECQIIDFTIHYYTREDDNEVEKIEKYLHLTSELKKV